MDKEGCAYITGDCGPNFPVTSGAFSTEPESHNVFITKINPSGSGLVYSAYIGGESTEEVFNIKVDEYGNVYIAGWTSSSDYPITANAYRKLIGNLDGFVTKINVTGNQLVYSTLLGGSSHDEVYNIDVDVQGCAYVTGITKSSDFPVTKGAYREKIEADFMEGFLAKLNQDGSDLIYSTLLGKTGYMYLFSVIVDDYGNAFVAGESEYEDYPVTSGAYHHFRGGVGDIFVTKINSDGTKALFSSFFGGRGQDHVTGIVLDKSGNPIICGYTESPDFPTTSGVFSEKFNGLYKDAFLTKLSADGSSLIFSTYFGGSSENSHIGRVCFSSLTIDQKDNIFVTGDTNLTYIPTTPDALSREFQGNGEAVFVAFAPDGSKLIYSTYLGGNVFESGRAITCDDKGNVYVTGDTHSSDFITTPGAYADTLTYGRDEYGWYIIGSDGFIAKFHFDDSPNTVDSEMDAPASFQITSVSPNPFNPSTAITFSLPSPAPATLAVYSVTGQKVATLLSGLQPAGSRTVRWDASGFASGVYFCRLEADGKAAVRKMMLVK